MDRADSLSKSTNNAKFSPAKRKSIYVVKTDGDDKERKHHRSDAEFEEKLLNCSISATQNSLNSSCVDQSKLPVNFEDNFNACLQMFMTNKINAQNAWNLNIFEYIKTLVESKSEAQYILQMASTSLDIGAKIYGLRVDDMYDNVLKLANTLSGLRMNEPESEEFDETDTLMEQPIKNKSKRKLNKENSKKTFVVEHEEAINGLIQKNKALDNPASDTTDSSRLFNVLSPKNPNHSFDLLIESKSKTYNWINKTSQRTNIGQCKKVNLELENLPTYKICPSLSDFIIGEDNLKMEENMDKNTFSEAIRRHPPNKKDLNISQYEYQNPNDSEFCNTICENGDWDGDDIEKNQEGAMENIENQMTFDVNTKILSDQSEYPCENVPFKIAYAQKAKKVDMKQLKSAMWSEICKDEKKVKIIEENSDIKEDEKIKKIQKDDVILLSQVYKDLHKKLPATMRENLSPALSFVSLLHLANEYSLILESKGLSDIIIKKS